MIKRDPLLVVIDDALASVESGDYAAVRSALTELRDLMTAVDVYAICPVCGRESGHSEGAMLITLANRPMVQSWPLCAICFDSMVGRLDFHPDKTAQLVSLAITRGVPRARLFS